MLVAPLDWGLGHATRCIPVIEKLLKTGFKVIIAAEGDQKILLQAAFPALEMFNLKGYRLQYGSTKWSTIFKIIFQSGKLLTAINAENRWLKDLITEKNISAVISDNRFGLYDERIACMFITHQLLIKTSLSRLVDGLVQRINYRFINRFTACWVPDAKSRINLAGQLSHPATLPRTALYYIGPLSRITKDPGTIKFKLLVILSGPEPQRSLLEKLVLQQLENLPVPACLVRGLPAGADLIQMPSHAAVFNYADNALMQTLINSSEIVLCRGGYSTIMDTVPLGKKCIFIPTPGQGEQQYLSRYLSKKGCAVTVQQHEFSLRECLERAARLSTAEMHFEETLTDAITALQEAIVKKQPEGKR